MDSLYGVWPQMQMFTGCNPRTIRPTGRPQEGDREAEAQEVEPVVLGGTAYDMRGMDNGT